MFEDFSFCLLCEHYDRNDRLCKLFDRTMVAGCPYGEERKPKNNFERLKAMSMEEMTAFLANIMDGGWGNCPDGYYDCSNRASCAECWAEWLKEDVDGKAE